MMYQILYSTKVAAVHPTKLYKKEQSGSREGFIKREISGSIGGGRHAGKSLKLPDKVRLVEIPAFISDGGQGQLVLLYQRQAAVEPVQLCIELGRNAGILQEDLMQVTAAHIVLPCDVLNFVVGVGLFHLVDDTAYQFNFQGPFLCQLQPAQQVVFNQGDLFIDVRFIQQHIMQLFDRPAQYSGGIVYLVVQGAYIFPEKNSGRMWK